MRVFVALPLPESLIAALETVQQGLGTGRSVPGDNMHVTLAFLGDQPQAVLEALHEELGNITAPAPELAVRGVDVFGGRHPRLVYAGLRKTGDLEALHAAVQRAVRAAGVELPRERFRPHVTLARFPRHLSGDAARRLGRFLEEEGALRLPAVTADRFALYASYLHEAGAVHEILAEYPLGRAGAPLAKPAGRT